MRFWQRLIVWSPASRILSIQPPATPCFSPSRPLRQNRTRQALSLHASAPRALQGASDLLQVRSSTTRQQREPAGPPPPSVPAHSTCPLGALLLQASMASAQDRLRLLARSWTMVAEGYDKSFSSRFAPWQHDAIAQLQAVLPAGGSGTIAVPACGPGRCSCIHVDGGSTVIRVRHLFCGPPVRACPCCACWHAGPTRLACTHPRCSAPCRPGAAAAGGRLPGAPDCRHRPGKGHGGGGAAAGGGARAGRPRRSAVGTPACSPPPLPGAAFAACLGSWTLRMVLASDG